MNIGFHKRILTQDKSQKTNKNRYQQDIAIALHGWEMGIWWLTISIHYQRKQKTDTLIYIQSQTNESI